MIEKLQIAGIDEICIIDDDSMALYLAEKIFEYEMENIPVRGFDAVDDALQYLGKSGLKRLIFVDLNMPGKDGWEFLNMYKGSPDKDLIFMLSSSDNAADKTKAATYTQVTAYLEKPMTIEKIIEIKNNY